MAFEMKEGSGSLFKNLHKEQPTHADYNGSILINGQEYWLNAWIKEGKSGKFMSVSAKPKQPKEQDKQPANAQKNEPMPAGFDGMDSDIPF